MRISRGRRASHLNSQAMATNLLVVDTQLAKGRFSFIYRDSMQMEIPVKHCFPIPGIRSIFQSGVSALMKELMVDESEVIGYSAAGGLKVVVKVPEEELALVRDYLLSKGESNSDATDKAFNQGIEWYGVVDGGHVHAPLLNLQDTRPETFLDFNWCVTVINWHPIATLRAFGRARNLLQPTHIFEMTLFDIVQAMQEMAMEKARLSGNRLEEMLRRRGIIMEVADEFSGGSQYSRQTIRTLAGAALAMKPEAVRTLGKVMNESNIELTKKMLEFGTERSIDGCISDDRAYRKIISTNTLRGATAFRNAEASDQSNALERLKYSFEANKFRCFQASRLSKEVERSLKARQQVRLMNGLMGTETWPQEMLDVQKKLLFSSLFDQELDEFDLSKDDILPCLVSMYRLKLPLESGIRYSLYCRERNLPISSYGRSQDSRIECSSNKSHSDDEDPNTSDCEDANEGDENRCPLQDLRITCLNITLEEFSVRRSADEDNFHLVVGDPTQLHLNGTCRNPISEQQADKIAGIMKSLTRPHGWAFIYTRPVDYHIWDKTFRANEFDPLDYAWPMVRNCDTVQANTSSIPQNITELMIGARRTHPGRPDFQPDIMSSYERNVCSRKRKFAIIDSCHEPTIKLKKQNIREPIRKNERSSEAIAEFVKTFCPENGNVLDAFSGTMETAKACCLTSRRCTALEADRMCYDLAVERLKESATNYVSSYTSANRISENRTEHQESEQESICDDVRVSPDSGHEDIPSSPGDATVDEEFHLSSESEPGK